MALPILQTKLFIPRPRSTLVPRTALLARLRTDDIPPLTLISAPVGFGKTTLVCEWLHELRITNYELRESARGEPTSVHLNAKSANPAVAWLSLDDEDNDLARFLAYLIAALQSCQARLGMAALDLLTAPQAPQTTAILTLLLNELSRLETPILLVLDDYHVITSAPIHAALTFLLDHLPPTLRLIIATRTDPPLPLARWRVRRQLAEMRVADLRFSAAETAAFLQQSMGLQLSEQTIATLMQRTEGWVAALQLVALSMRGRADLPNFILAFSGSNRYIVDYLAEEVWQRLPNATQNFLMQSALLERFCADLCGAVTGQPDAQSRLADLEQANLFLIALDDERKWYRYHHLFRDLLLQRLRTQADVATIQEMHQRAAHWYRMQGLIDEAIRHYLAAAAVDQAAELIEEIGFERIGQGHLFRLRSWLDLLPLETVRAYPRLTLWRAWTLNLTGQPAALAQWLQETELSVQGMPAALAQDLQAQLTTLRAYQLRRQGKLDLAITQLKQVLNQCAPENYLTRSTATLNLGFNYWLTGQLTLADQALQMAQSDANVIQAIHIVLMAKSIQANVAVAQGRLRQAVQLCEATIQAGLAHTGGQPFASAGYAYAVLGNIWYEQNQWEKAETALQQALELGELVLDGTIVRRAIFGLAPLNQLRGDKVASQALWQRAFAADDTVEEPHVLLQQVRTWLIQTSLLHDQAALTQAGQWAATYNHPETNQPSCPAVCAQILFAWIDLLQGQPTRTITRLSPLLESTAAAGQTQYQLDILALQALAHAAVGDLTTAYTQLYQLLTRAAPEGYIRLFVDRGEPMRRLIHDARSQNGRLAPVTIDAPALVGYLDQLLTAFDRSPMRSTDEPATSVQKATSQAPESENPRAKILTLVEPLSDREREILRLVAAGLSNSEIADKLIVTVGTVKKHLNNIYGKLGVGTRTQAIARGRELALL